MAAYRIRWRPILDRLTIPPYESLAAAAESASALRETDRRQIEADLSRSAVQAIEISDEDKPARRASLRRLLRSWCILRPDMGYSQAMNFIMAVALFVSGNDEPIAFAIFVALVQRLPQDFYAEAPPLRGFQIELTALTTLLEHRAPHFVDAGEGAVREALPLVVCKWFLNLFVDALPFPALLAVWDLLLTDPMLLDTTPPTSGGTLMDSAKYPEMAASHETPPRAGSPTVSSPTIPTDGLLRVTLALISAHEGAILAALGSTGCPDASVAYSSLLDISNDAVNPADLIGAAKEISLEPATVFTLRNMARASLEEADAAEAILRGGGSEAPSPPARLREQQYLLKFEELNRLKTALQEAASDHHQHRQHQQAATNGELGPGNGSCSSGAHAHEYDGNGGIGRDTFRRILLAETPKIVDAGMRVHEVLCSHGERVVLPSVPWRELTAALATAMRGSLTERLGLVFELFDPTQSGLINVPNMMSIASMLFKLRLLDPSAAERPISASRRSSVARPSCSTYKTPSTASTSARRSAAHVAASACSGIGTGAPSTSSAAASSRATTPAPSSLDMQMGSCSGRNSEVSLEDAGNYSQASDRRSLRSDDGAAGLVRGSEDGRLSIASEPDQAMCRMSAPVMTSPLAGDGRNTTGGGNPPAGPFGTASGARGARGSQRRRGSLDIAADASSQPRLRRVATVTGAGDRYEMVDQQVNELLQLLLVMDVDKDGSLSYDEWTRGVLSLPEVLACFQLASSFAQASPTASTWAERSIEVRRQQVQRANTTQVGWNQHKRSERVEPPMPPPMPTIVSSVSGALWWRSVWRSMLETVACASCGVQHV